MSRRPAPCSTRTRTVHGQQTTPVSLLHAAEHAESYVRQLARAAPAASDIQARHRVSSRAVGARSRVRACHENGAPALPRETALIHGNERRPG